MRSTFGLAHAPPIQGAIVIGGDRIALGAVRSLGRQGLPVWVLVGEHRVATTSRYCTRTLPWPRESEAAQCAWLLELAATHGLQGWIIFPSDDESAAMLSRHHAVLAEHFALTTPPWETLRWAYDKRLTNNLAAHLNIPTPQTWYPQNEDQLSALIEQGVTFPAVLKPAYKRDSNRFTNARAWRVDNADALIERYRDALALVPPDVIMLQALIPGRGEAQFSFAALCQDGTPIVSAVAQRVRQFPPEFGRASTHVETVEQPDVEALARRFLAAMGISGLVEVELKRDRRDGQFKLLDVNARLWGWHTLGSRHGFDFVAEQLRLLMRGDVKDVRIPPGERWIRHNMDLAAAIHEIREGCLKPRRYVRSLLQPHDVAVFAKDDPWPAVLDLPLLGLIGAHRWLEQRIAGLKHSYAPPSVLSSNRLSRHADPDPAAPAQTHDLPRIGPMPACTREELVTFNETRAIPIGSGPFKEV